MIRILKEEVTNNDLKNSVYKYENAGIECGCSILMRKEPPIPNGHDAEINIAISANYLLVQYQGPNDENAVKKELSEFIRRRFCNDDRQ